MRIVLIGQAAFAEQVLDGLRAARPRGRGRLLPARRAGAKPDPLKARALELGIPVHQHASLKGPDVRARVRPRYSADLGVLAYVTQIVPQTVFEAPRLGSICFHPSLLPRYRGGSAIPWQIIKGETRTGVSVFWVDPGIDTGPILLQKEAAIGPDDTAGSLYYDTLFKLGVDTVLEVGRADRRRHGAAHGAGRVAGDRTIRCAATSTRTIDWQRPVAEVYNLIRGCDPQPGAFVRAGGDKVRLYDARRARRRRRAPGVVAAIDERRHRRRRRRRRHPRSGACASATRSSRRARQPPQLGLQVGDRFERAAPGVRSCGALG